MVIFDEPTFNERLFFPRRGASKAPDGARDQRIRVSSPDAELHLRVYGAPPAAKCLVLFFHGNGEIVSDYDDAALMFANAGAQLAVMDYRGYGESTGTPTLRSTIDDSAPVLVAIQSYNATTNKLPLIVMGRSLGASCAIELYSKCTTDSQRSTADIAGFIIESGASDILALIRRRGMTVNESALDEATRSFFDPLKKLPKGQQPLLIMHGQRDEMIAKAEAERAFEIAGTPREHKTLALIPDRGHNDISFSPLYWSTLASFIDRVSR